MTKKNPYQVVKNIYVTEKSTMLLSLKDKENNPSVKRCKSPKYVFVVAPDANKHEIKVAVEEIYSAQKVKVVNVNTITMKPKAKRMRGIYGKKAGFKKAVVTLQEGDNLGFEEGNK